MKKEYPMYHEMGYPNAISVTQNGNVADENCYQYEFLNLSNVPVMINGMFLDRYYTGNRAAPTIIPGANIRWAPIILAGERDTTSYQVVFLDTFYPGLIPSHQLIVMKKNLTPMPYNRNRR